MALPQSYVTVSRRPPDVEDYIDMLRRYRSWIIGPMFLGLVASTVVAFLWPDTFVSMAVMRISPQQVSERLVPAEFNTQMTQRLNEMEQEILSRTTLEGIITDPALDLYKRDRAQRPMEDIVSDMRSHDISIKPITMPGSMSMDLRQMATAFSISFQYQDKFKAQAVVRSLVAKFTEQNVTVQRNQAKLTTQFLDDELHDAKEKLTNLDDAIAKFKMDNNGKLPEEMTSNVSMLNNLQTNKSQFTMALQNAMDRKAGLETALATEVQQLQFYKENTEETVPVAQAVQQQVKNQELAAANARLASLNETMANASQTYGKNSPEIKGLRAQITAVQATKDKLEKEEADKGPDTPAPAGPSSKTLKNKNAEQAALSEQGMIDNTRLAIAQAADNIKTIQAQQADNEKRIAMYESRIEAAPLNERQWAQLQRDHLIAQQEYDDKQKKRAAAETAQNLEEHKAGETLEVLDPPSDPQAPTQPKRAQWAAMGTGLGLLLGIVLAGAKEMKNTSLKNLKDVRAYTNLPVLSSIPLLENALLVRRKRRLFWLAWSGAFIFGSMAVLASVYYYYVGQK